MKGKIEELNRIAESQYEVLVEMVEALRKAQEDDDDDALEEAERAIDEDALSVQVRSAWTNPGFPLGPDEYCILLSTGGPATRIVGKIGLHFEPVTATLEAQDWFTVWTPWFGADEEVLLEYAGRFFACVE